MPSPKQTTASGANHFHCRASRYNLLFCRDRRGILLGRRVTSGCDRKVAYVANTASAVTIDCVDPQRAARFGCDLLGREPGRRRTAWSTWAIAAIPIRTWCSSGCRGQLGGIQNLARACTRAPSASSSATQSRRAARNQFCTAARADLALVTAQAAITAASTE